MSYGSPYQEAPSFIARSLSVLLHSPIRDELKEVQTECRFQKRATPFLGLHSHSRSEGNNENELEDLCFRSSCGAEQRIRSNESAHQDRSGMDRRKRTNSQELVRGQLWAKRRSSCNVD